MDILGISAGYHDSAVALVRDGRVIAAAQEERFSRKKHDAAFPVRALRWCVEAGGGRTPDAVAFYEKPLRKLHRVLQTHFAVAPAGIASFVAAVPSWLHEKLWTPLAIEDALGAAPPIYFADHHTSHAASAFYPSPFAQAAVLTVDGVGEWATASLGIGDGASLELSHELRFPHSLGLLYSAFTSFLGFEVNDGEAKVMGLAPYGEPRFVDLIREHLVEIHEDGSLRLNLEHFGFLDRLSMTKPSFARLFGPPRAPEGELSQTHADLARSIQAVTEEVILRMARHLHARTGETRVCLAGGLALNGVANGRLLREGPFREVWVQPAAGDAGAALGAALWAWHAVTGHPRTADGVTDGMDGGLLGPGYDDATIEAALQAAGQRYRRLAPADRAAEIARRVAEQQVVAVFDGRMELGPRALGARSILADARSPTMQATLNQRIKFRESFRPFAPACLAHRAAAWFEIDRASPYMAFVVPVRAEHRVAAEPAVGLRERAAQARSTVPAITHVDHTARLQTVDVARHPGLFAILTEFERLTGCPMMVNTSFNVRGEPIVQTPEDALRCFLRTGIDALVLGPFLIVKA